MSKILSCLLLSAAFSAACAQGTTTPLSSCSQMGIGQGASLNGFVPFPTTDPLNEDISKLPLDPSITMSLYGGSPLHPDFGPGTYQGINIGMPYEVVGPQSLTPVVYNMYGSQSDPGPMPIPSNAPVEGAGATGYNDHHVFVLSQSTCFLYELYHAALQSDGSWTAASGAVWDMLSDNDRPYNWTSADAAGLPIFPTLVRYDEVASGAIHHALRFTLNYTRDSFIAPATHMASSTTNVKIPPMGTRLRLKASFDISKYPPQTKVILQALKTYGMILADNGSTLFISGTHDSRWNASDLQTLHNLVGADFEAVLTGPTWTTNAVPKGPAPVITTFTSNVPTTTTGSTTTTTKHTDGGKTITTTTTVPGTTATSYVNPGTAVTLTWAGSNASYYVLTPGVGAVRGTSVVVKPTVTTTYTLVANSHFGSTTKTITVNVN